jgi:hypothetical protein
MKKTTAVSSLTLAALLPLFAWTFACATSPGYDTRQAPGAGEK